MKTKLAMVMAVLCLTMTGLAETKIHEVQPYPMGDDGPTQLVIWGTDFNDPSIFFGTHPDPLAIDEFSTLCADMTASPAPPLEPNNFDCVVVDLPPVSNGGDPVVPSGDYLLQIVTVGEEAVCGEKPSSLTFTYMASACSASSNSQDGSTCTGDDLSGMNIPVISTTGKDADKWAIDASVPGQYTFTSSGSKWGNKLNVLVQDAPLSQNISLHTSCSQPLVLGDVYGSLTLSDYIGNGGGATVQNDLYDLTLGAVGPEGPQGPQGKIGPQGVQGKLGDQGPQGKLGDQGVQGKLGDQGVQGKLGDQGVQGKLGPQGVQGKLGDQGVQGKLGDQGPQGKLGDQGPQGKLGDQGVQGKLGPQGPQGKLGNTGADGQACWDTDGDGIGDPEEDFNGDTFVDVMDCIGAAGSDGDQGVQGKLGDQGPQGKLGDQGVQGKLGPQGVQGKLGDQGVQGKLGDQGPQGKLGDQGVQGKLGPQGPQGKLGNTGADGQACWDTDGDGIGDPEEDFNGDTFVDVMDCIGAAGSDGDQGVQGKLGPQGVQGKLGDQGPQGKLGDQGVQGKLGDQGVQGKLGPQGVQGKLGDQGPQGKLGDQGVQGKLGPQGPQGKLGDQGVQGKLGPQGVQGKLGDQGPQGKLGDQGVQGKLGPQGPQGKLGDQGVQGKLGDQGVQGKLGDQGPQGKLGDQGPQGKLGDQGVQGKLGPQGVQGKLGDQGPQGKLGDQGVQGKLGDQGVQGKLGDQGVQGKLGPQGPQGKLGDQGVQGKLGPQGVQGLACWDLDGDGVADTEEDINGDTFVDVADCKGAKGDKGSADVFLALATDQTIGTQGKYIGLGSQAGDHDHVSIVVPAEAGATVTMFVAKVSQGNSARSGSASLYKDGPTDEGTLITTCDLDGVAGDTVTKCMNMDFGALGTLVEKDSLSCFINTTGGSFEAGSCSIIINLDGL